MTMLTTTRTSGSSSSSSSRRKRKEYGISFLHQGSKRKKVILYFLVFITIVGMSWWIMMMKKMKMKMSTTSYNMNMNKKKIASIKTTTTKTMVTMTKDDDDDDDDDVLTTSFYSSVSSLWKIIMEPTSFKQEDELDRIKDNEKVKVEEVEKEKVEIQDEDDVISNFDSKISSSLSSSSSSLTTNKLIHSTIHKLHSFFVDDEGVVNNNKKDVDLDVDETKIVHHSNDIRDIKITVTKDKQQDDYDDDHDDQIMQYYGIFDLCWKKWNEIILKMKNKKKKNKITIMENDHDEVSSHYSEIKSTYKKKKKKKNNHDDKEEYNNNNDDNNNNKIGNLRISSYSKPQQNLHGISNSNFNRNEWNHRLLQIDDDTTTSTTSSLICSNITDTFQTTYVLLIEGNESLFTETQANLLASTFASSYNNQSSSSTTTTTTTICDPFFRTITQIQVSANISFTGVNTQGDIIDNPLPMIPVRRRRKRNRKLQRSFFNPHDDDDDDGDDYQPSTTMEDWKLWKSSHLEFEKIIKNLQEKEDGRGDTTMIAYPQERILQQQQQQLQQLNRTTLGRSRVVLLLLDIYGSCRGCQGQSPAFDLFDDISSFSSSSSSPVVRNRGRRQQEHHQEHHQERDLQDNQDNVINDDDDNDCICPADAVLGDSTDFQSSFNSKVEDLRDNGEIEFVEQVEEVIPVLETKCPTKNQDFSTVFLVSDLVFSRSVLFSLGVEGVQEVELLFRDSYNGISQQLCDPLYRTVTKNQLVSIEQQEGQGSTMVRMEFVVDATCRGNNCIEVGCIFDDAGVCGGVDQRERNLKDTIIRPPLPQSIVPEYMTSYNTIGSSSRLLKEDEDDEERCFCRKGRANRPPTPQEFKEAFQKGLNDITENNKLSSCQGCSFPSDCRSGVCFAGRCAEADTQLLLNSCPCRTNGECESGFCLDALSTTENGGGSSGEVIVSGTCQGKLTSCRVCNNGEECLSGVCTGGRCAEAIDGKLKTGCECNSNLNCQTGRCVDDFINIGVPGKCTERISNTCTEPCLLSTDCLSGVCGSVVCLPVNGTLLPDGCKSTLRTECENGMLLNNICITASSEVPSFEPSLQQTPGPTSQPSPEPSASPTFELSAIPTTGPTPGPTSQPSPEPSTSPTFELSAIPSSVPSTGPSHWPSTGPSREPSTSPTFHPSNIPSSVPSTGPSIGPSTGPSREPSTPPTTLPSQLPSISPSVAPSTSPSITPTTQYPSFLPSLSPTTSPSTLPSFTPSTSSPSRFPSVGPSNGGTPSPLFTGTDKDDKDKDKDKDKDGGGGGTGGGVTVGVRRRGRKTREKGERNKGKRNKSERGETMTLPFVEG